MERKMVSCLVCISENDIVSAEFFNDLDVAYSELDRQAHEEAKKLVEQGCGQDGVSVVEETESIMIVWHLNRDYVIAENPGMAEDQIDKLCQPHEMVFHVFFGTIK